MWLNHRQKLAPPFLCPNADGTYDTWCRCRPLILLRQFPFQCLSFSLDEKRTVREQVSDSNRLSLDKYSFAYRPIGTHIHAHTRTKSAIVLLLCETTPTYSLIVFVKFRATTCKRQRFSALTQHILCEPTHIVKLLSAHSSVLTSKNK